MNHKRYIIDEESEGMRVDRFIRRELPHLPLSSIHKIFRKKDIKVNTTRVKKDYRLENTDSVDVYYPVPPDTGREKTSKKEMPPPDKKKFKREFSIIHEDEDLLLCNKPAGLVVHPGTGHNSGNTLIGYAKSYFETKGLTTDINLVHRIDKETSGIILISKNRKNLRVLNKEMREGGFRKEYFAVCHNNFSEDHGIIDKPLNKRFQRNNGTKITPGWETGKASLSEYWVEKNSNGFSLVRVLLHTGRTHQIRVHMSSINCPVLGDRRYGERKRDRAVFLEADLTNRLYLHAESISFSHPVSGKPLTFKAPLPELFLSPV
ncbi:MAG: RluA family pseudouridine synthase [Chitinivibrionales bacterium]